MTPDASTPGGGGHRAGRVAAQAKVNLLLRVLGREPSGYHQLETVFQRLDLADDVVVRTGVSGRSVDCTGEVIPETGLGPAEANLAYRAALAYREATGWPDGFAIEIVKRIPVGGGLGGGSADAGAVLRILEALAPRPIGIRILELAAALGADVPFLATETPLAMAWGRGERMLALAPLPRRRVQLIVPRFGVPTAEAYAWLAASRPDYRPTGALLPAAALGDWAGVEEVATNDFSSVVELRHPGIGAYRRALMKGGARVALMAGSGSTVFGVFEEGARGLAAADLDQARLVETRTAAHVVPVRPID